MRSMLTARTLNKKPKKVRYEITDEMMPTLKLQVHPSGARSWIMRFRRPNGRGGVLKLGRVELGENTAEPVLGGSLTLGAARQLAHSINRQLASGIDVIAEHKARKLRDRTDAIDKATNTFTAAAREFFVTHKIEKRGRPRRWVDDARTVGLVWPKDCDPARTEPTIIKGSLASLWHDKPLAEIDRRDVSVKVDEARKSGIPGLDKRNRGESENRARKLFAILSVFFNWAHGRDKIATNPMIGLKRPHAPTARERVLTDAEIKSFWLATDKITAPFGNVLRLLLLSGCRANEVIAMRRSELSEEGVWTIPGARTKNHRPHTLPLPPAALETIDWTGKGKPVEGEFVFTLNGRTPVSGWSKIKKRLDEIMQVPPWRVHDLRRTAATGMVELGVLPHVVEAVLNHVSGAKAGVAGIYNRSELMPERKAALLRWSRHVAGLVADKPGKVTNIADERRKKKAQRS